MFIRLVQKELLDRLLDFRFIAVFAFCILLAVLSVYTGIQNYVRQLREYSVVTENNRRAFKEVTLEKGALYDLIWRGYQWNQRPEALSVLVYGLSGTLGREALIRYQDPSILEGSEFETDPIHTLFETLDLAFVVKVVFSLCVVLFTFDAICGEKEGGTLRLYASFPVPRSTLALAKLAGSALSVLVPFCFVFLLSALMLALSPEAGLRTGEWLRIAALMGLFWCYLVVFVAFSLFVSALTHRRKTAFLGLLGLWVVWVFVIPDVAVDASRWLSPTESYYSLDRQVQALRWETRIGALSETDGYIRGQREIKRDWNRMVDADKEIVVQNLPQPRQEEVRLALHRIRTKWDAETLSRLRDLQAERRNQVRRQQRLAMVLSAASPAGGINVLSMDLARTGFIQREHLEDALNGYLISFAELVQRKLLKNLFPWGVDLSDFTWFDYQDTEPLGACLSRNALHILNLALLAILGFAGAYVAILRYDVR